ncbi:hypothetical protein IAT38_001782 [Cryptococcus sp. DSM 104549]
MALPAPVGYLYWYTTSIILFLLTLLNLSSKLARLARHHNFPARLFPPPTTTNAHTDTSRLGRTARTTYMLLEKYVFLTGVPVPRAHFWRKKNKWKGLPTPEVAWRVGYTVGFLVLAFYGTGWDRLTYSNQAAWLAVAQVPLIIALAGKNNVVSFLTGIAYDRLNFIHRAAGNLCLLGVWIHAAGHWSLTHGWNEAAWHRTISHWGFTGIFSITLLALISLPWFRRRMFEFFLVMHIVLVALMLAAFVMHWRAMDVWIYPGVGLWAADRILRVVRMVYYNHLYPCRHPSSPPSSTSSTPSTQSSQEKLPPPPSSHPTQTTLSLLTPSTLLLTVPSPSSHLSWAAGQHFYISVPGLSRFPWESHPFTACTIPGYGVAGLTPKEIEEVEQELEKEKGGEKHSGSSRRAHLRARLRALSHPRHGHHQPTEGLAFIIRVRDGFTKRLKDRVDAEQRALGLGLDEGCEVAVRAGVEGPYGVKSDLEGYDGIVLFAGGSGVSFAVAHLLQVMRDVKAGRSKVRFVNIVWMVTSRLHLDWITPLLAPHLPHLPPSLNVTLNIHVTRRSFSRLPISALPAIPLQPPTTPAPHPSSPDIPSTSSPQLQTPQDPHHPDHHRHHAYTHISEHAHTLSAYLEKHAKAKKHSRRKSRWSVFSWASWSGRDARKSTSAGTTAPGRGLGDGGGEGSGGRGTEVPGTRRESQWHWSPSPGSTSRKTSHAPGGSVPGSQGISPGTSRRESHAGGSHEGSSDAAGGSPRASHEVQAPAFAWSEGYAGDKIPTGHPVGVTREEEEEYDGFAPMGSAGLGGGMGFGEAMRRGSSMMPPVMEEEVEVVLGGSQDGRGESPTAVQHAEDNEEGDVGISPKRHFRPRFSLPGQPSVPTLGPPVSPSSHSGPAFPPPMRSRQISISDTPIIPVGRRASHPLPGMQPRGSILIPTLMPRESIVSAGTGPSRGSTSGLSRAGSSVGGGQAGSVLAVEAPPLTRTDSSSSTTSSSSSSSARSGASLASFSSQVDLSLSDLPIPGLSSDGTDGDSEISRPGTPTLAFQQLAEESGTSPEEMLASAALLSAIGDRKVRKESVEGWVGEMEESLKRRASESLNGVVGVVSAQVGAEGEYGGKGGKVGGGLGKGKGGVHEGWGEVLRWGAGRANLGECVREMMDKVAVAPSSPTHPTPAPPESDPDTPSTTATSTTADRRSSHDASSNCSTDETYTNSTTRAKVPTATPAPNPTNEPPSQTVPGSDVEAHPSPKARSTGGRIWVGACGPKSLLDSSKEAVRAVMDAKGMWSGGVGVDFHAETFGS